MALEKMHKFREDIFVNYLIACIYVHHSLGKISVGEICFFEFTSSTHRKAAIDACLETVERIKAELPKIPSFIYFSSLAILKPSGTMQKRSQMRSWWFLNFDKHTGY
jgi:hypothetical protein